MVNKLPLRPTFERLHDLAPCQMSDFQVIYFIHQLADTHDVILVIATQLTYPLGSLAGPTHPEDMLIGSVGEPTSIHQTHQHRAVDYPVVLLSDSL